MTCRCKELEAELARVREALEQIPMLSDSQQRDQLYPNTAGGWEMCCDDMVDIARAALGEGSQ